MANARSPKPLLEMTDQELIAEGTKYYDNKPPDYENAIKYYEVARQRGYAEAFYHLGYIYSFGTGVPIDYIKARQYLEKYLQAGLNSKYDVSLVYIWLGDAYLKPADSRYQDIKKAEDYYQKGRKLGSGRAAFYLGKMYATSKDVKKDEAKAKELFNEAEDLRFTPTDEDLSDGDVKQLFSQRTDGLKDKSAEELYELGAKYCKPPYKISAKYFLMASEKQDFKALDQNKKSTVYNILGANARDNLQDDQKAMEYWQLAFDLKNKLAAYNLGLLYFSSKVFPRDDEKAKEFFREAAALGFTETDIPVDAAPKIKELFQQRNKKKPEAMTAKELIAAGEEEYKKVPPKYKEAFDYFELAKRRGDLEAFFHTGFMLYLGQGVSKNLEKAEADYSKYIEETKTPYATAFVHLGDIAFNKKEYDKALTFYTNALNPQLDVVNPMKQRAIKNIITIYQSKKEYGKAAQHAKKYRNEVGEKEFYFLSGLSYATAADEKARDEDKAKNCFKDAVAIGLDEKELSDYPPDIIDLFRKRDEPSNKTLEKYASEYKKDKEFGRSLILSAICYANDSKKTEYKAYVDVFKVPRFSRDNDLTILVQFLKLAIDETQWCSFNKVKKAYDIADPFFVVHLAMARFITQRLKNEPLDIKKWPKRSSLEKMEETIRKISARINRSFVSFWIDYFKISKEEAEKKRDELLLQMRSLEPVQVEYKPLPHDAYLAMKQSDLQVLREEVKQLDKKTSALNTDSDEKSLGLLKQEYKECQKKLSDFREDIRKDLKMEDVIMTLDRIAQRIMPGNASKIGLYGDAPRKFSASAPDEDDSPSPPGGVSPGKPKGPQSL